MPERSDVSSRAYEPGTRGDSAVLEALCSSDVEVYALTSISHRAGLPPGRAGRLPRRCGRGVVAHAPDAGRARAAGRRPGAGGRRFQARARLSGVENDQLLGVIFGLSGGKIASMHAYSSVRGAREAARGVTPLERYVARVERRGPRGVARRARGRRRARLLRRARAAPVHRRGGAARDPGRRAAPTGTGSSSRCSTTRVRWRRRCSPGSRCRRGPRSAGCSGSG